MNEKERCARESKGGGQNERDSRETAALSNANSSLAGWFEGHEVHGWPMPVGCLAASIARQLAINLQSIADAVY